MNRQKILGKVLVCMLCWAGMALAQTQQAPADLVLYNGKIITVDDHSFSSRLGTIAQAMHVQNGKILHIGNNTQIRAMAGPNTKVIDLKGRTVIPGFILTHEHPYDWGSVHINALKKYLTDDLVVYRTLEGSPVENAKAFPGLLQEAVSKAKPGEWIYMVVTNGPHDEYQGASNGSMSRALVDPSVRVPNELKITKVQLDQWAPNNPVYAGGWLVNNIFSGSPEGGINQKAIDEVIRVMSDPRMDPLIPLPPGVLRSSTPSASTRRWVFHDVIMKDFYPQLVQIQKSSLDWWAGYGMTTFSSNSYAPSNRRVYAELDRKGEMPIRNMWTWNWNPEYLYEDPFFITDLAARLGQGSDYLWFGGATVTIGANCMSVDPLPNSKALQYRREQSQGQPASRGEGGGSGGGGQGPTASNCNYAPGSRSAETITKYIRAGGRFINLHTSGDQDIDNMMLLIEKVSKEAGMTEEEIRAKRHGMDHMVMWPRPEQIPVMKHLGILASGDSYEIVSASPSVFDMYGEKVASWVVPHKRLVEAGINSTFEIDRPLQTTTDVTIFTVGIAPMILRKAWDGKVYAQDQQVDRETALKIATYRGAYYVLRENQLGSLEPGKFADFQVLDKDYLTVPVEQIQNLRVLLTVVGGKVVHLVPSLAREIGMPPAGEQVTLGGAAAQW